MVLAKLPLRLFLQFEKALASIFESLGKGGYIWKHWQSSFSCCISLALSPLRCSAFLFFLSIVSNLWKSSRKSINETHATLSICSRKLQRKLLTAFVVGLPRIRCLLNLLTEGIEQRYPSYIAKHSFMIKLARSSWFADLTVMTPLNHSRIQFLLFCRASEP